LGAKKTELEMHNIKMKSKVKRQKAKAKSEEGRVQNTQYRIQNTEGKRGHEKA
jgi:hypothetical protein